MKPLKLAYAYCADFKSEAELMIIAIRDGGMLTESPAFMRKIFGSAGNLFTIKFFMDIFTSL